MLFSMTLKYKTLIIKIGTNVLTDDSGFLNQGKLEEVVSELVALKKQGVKIILVTSGAVGTGRGLFKDYQKIQNRIVARQILASLGQGSLISNYSNLFSRAGVLCSQILVTKEDFRDRRHYLNLRNCLEGSWGLDIIPILNENDAISVNTISFTDNDELAGLVASMLGAEALIIMTSVDGMYAGNPSDINSKLITKISFEDDEAKKFITKDKSSLGTGGMLSKYKVAKKAAGLGIDTYFLNGLKSGLLTKLLQGETVGTHFLPKSKISSRKKWLANTSGFEKATIFIDEGAKNALINQKEAVSLLPVGIQKIEGEFNKSDILKICDENGIVIGYGLAQYSSHEANKYLKESNHRPLVHYDYLFLQTEN
jgi:glutamate 5-kinase